MFFQQQINSLPEDVGMTQLVQDFNLVQHQFTVMRMFVHLQYHNLSSVEMCCLEKKHQNGCQSTYTRVTWMAIARECMGRATPSHFSGIKRWSATSTIWQWRNYVTTSCTLPCRVCKPINERRYKDLSPLQCTAYWGHCQIWPLLSSISVYILSIGSNIGKPHSLWKGSCNAQQCLEWSRLPQKGNGVTNVTWRSDMMQVMSWPCGSGLSSKLECLTKLTAAWFNYCMPFLWCWY